MIQRLSDHLGSKPRQRAIVMLAIVVALVVTSAALLVMAIQSSGIFEPPYPSEPSPLSLVTNGVRWTQPYTDILPEGGGLTYINFSLAWAVNREGGRVSTAWHLIDESDQAALNAGVPATVRASSWSIRIWDVWLNVTVHDLSGDGSLGIGDSFTFELSPLLENRVFTMAWAWTGEHLMYTEYSFAIHDGKLYAWTSHDFSTEGPWWGSS